MFKSNIVAIIAYLLASTALGMEVILGTGLVNSPLFDGAFSDIGVGTGAAVFMCLTDESVFNAYANDSAGLYSAWQNGDFDSEQYKVSGNTVESSSAFRQSFSYPVSYNEDEDFQMTFYALAVATYDSSEFDRSYYIARIVPRIFSGDPSVMPCYISGIVSGAGSWSVVPEPRTTALVFLGLSAIGLRRKTSLYF